MEKTHLEKIGFKYHEAFENWYLEFKEYELSIRFRNDKAIVRVHHNATSIIVPNCETKKDLDRLIRLFKV